jgi:Zn finger protein HypA/HybF involved in hydrogenase expression
VHELSLVAELVGECERRAGGARVRLVRVRHAATLPEAALRQAFELLSGDGVLAEAELRTEPLAVNLECACGFAGPLGHDDLVEGVATVCPSCGAVSPRRRGAELELLEVRTDHAG